MASYGWIAYGERVASATQIAIGVSAIFQPLALI